jgi:hypothetical protein
MLGIRSFPREVGCDSVDEFRRGATRILPTVRRAMTDLASPSIPETAPVADLRLTTLEERVRVLEETVSRLQDTHQIEERVTAKVAERVAAATPTPSNPMTDGLRQSAGVLLGAGKVAATAAVGVLTAGAAAAEAHARIAPAPGRRPWLLFEIFAEFRSMFRMYFDKRFALPWTARVLPLILLIALLTSGFWPGLFLPLPASTPEFLREFILGFVQKIVDLILALFLWKIMQREVQRYREALAGLPPV